MAKSNFNIYETITERIISQLEQGTIPWKKEWCMPHFTGKIDLTKVAFNRTTKKPYSLLNQMMLGKTGEYEEAEKIKTAYMERENMEIHEITTNEAFYSPMGDYVQVPCRKQYTKQDAFYSTLFHEMTHSTGHSTRLDRLDSKARFGNEIYSKEELVAEIGACTLLNMLGLETDNSFNNSVAYIKSWIEVLKNDNRFIVSATSKAEKAVNYILTGEKPKTYGE